RLNPGGLVSITRWLKLPPRDSLKLFANAVQALGRMGVAKPGRQLALIRGGKTSTLLIKNGAFSGPEIIAIKRFSRERAFDVVYFPGITPADPNRYHLLERPLFFESAISLLGPAGEDFIDRYKYDIRPVTDDRPYFFNFFKWPLFNELYALRGRGGFGLLEWGYPVLALILLQAIVLALVLIPLPLWAGRRAKKAERTPRPSMRVLIYFLSLGFAFLFVEMAFIQKFILFLASPVYAAAVVLCGFLVFAGLGSLLSGRFLSSANPSLYPIVGIAVVGVAYLFLLPSLFQWLTALALAAKFTLSLLLIAPLAFPMGMPFPLGLARLGEERPGLIPWAWAINGCASVLGAVIAALLAIEFGFTAVIVMALGFYILACWTFPGSAADGI
ncbi:MAG: hypothetical protein MK294_04390, partial [Rhodospirillales bacterium]|nr:hypothetical protein [Rhodospirillales bacterium]